MSSTQTVIIDQQITIRKMGIVPAITLFLPTYEREAVAEFQQKLFQLANQSVFVASPFR